MSGQVARKRNSKVRVNRPKSLPYSTGAASHACMFGTLAARCCPITVHALRSFCSNSVATAQPPRLPPAQLTAPVLPLPCPALPALTSRICPTLLYPALKP